MQGHRSGLVETTNPATGEHLESYPIFSDDEVAQVARRARAAFEKWRKLSVDERSDYLRKLASALRAKKNDYARLMTLEMGKPISQSESEIEKCAWTAEYYAEKTKSWLAEEFVETDAKSSFVEFDPLGVILSVMPWNYPFWQVLRFAIPTVVAGNTSILRHSTAWLAPGARIRRRAQSGLGKPHRQCAGRDSEWRPAGGQCTPRWSARHCAHCRRWPRNSAADSFAHLRSLLHHETLGAGNRSWPRHRPPPRSTQRWPHRSRLRAGPHGISCLPCPSSIPDPRCPRNEQAGPVHRGLTIRRFSPQCAAISALALPRELHRHQRVVRRRSAQRDPRAQEPRRFSRHAHLRSAHAGNDG